MGAIQFTDRGTAVRVRQETRTLAQAAVAALPAPSIFNSQPWRWRISDEGAELRADRARQLHALDPDGRLLTVSCGIALHHALTSLAAQGAEVDVDRFPDVTTASGSDLLARIRVLGQKRPDPVALRLNAAMAVRRTDRRPFSEAPVAPEKLDRLGACAEANGAHLHLLRSDEVVGLTAAAGRASTIEAHDPAYRAELMTWTHRDTSTHDGIPTSAAVDTALARPVPIRSFTGSTESCSNCPPLADRAARYAVIFTDRDEPLDWLAAGEAVSAVLLTAADEGIAASPMTDVVEVPLARWRLRTLLSGVGYPVVVLRLGVAADRNPESATPRRAATDIIEVVSEETDPAVEGAAPA